MTSRNSATARPQKRPAIGSRDNEPLILVDEHNRTRGSAGKIAVHRQGLLHRAFSIFVVDRQGRLLLQQRSSKKYHSGGLWANSCCGHPQPGERTLAAAHRRLGEELGIQSMLHLGFLARYRADLDNGMQENEFVYVFFGPFAGEPQPNPDEVADVAFLSPQELRRRIKSHPGDFVYWLKHYFANHFATIARLARDTSRGG
jgi:isopentenyl-diphosphate Delta-isomerase